MLAGIRNWLDVRAALKDARRLRADQTTLNRVVVGDKLKHATDMLRAGETGPAAATMDEILERYPNETADLPGAIDILIALRRLDEAEALAVRGMRANPDSRAFAHLYCDIADHRDDIDERLRRWRGFRRRYPAMAMGFSREAHTLLAAGQPAAAEALLREGVRVVPDDLGLAIDYARRAEARQDWPEAYRRWVVVRDVLQAAQGAPEAAMALARQGLLEQAEADLLASRERFPAEAPIALTLAELAEQRGDIAAALARWAEIRRDFPHVIRGYTEAARLLRASGEAAAADALIVDAAMRAPQERELQFAYVSLAEGVGDWAEAARRWQVVRQHFPNETIAIAREAAALRLLGRLDEAEALLVPAVERFPAAADIRQACAELAEARGDLALAAQHWRAVVAAVPQLWWAHTNLARTLEQSGAPADADEALAAAIARLPEEANLRAEHARLAARSGRADVAAERWAAARARLGPLSALARAEAGWLRDRGDRAAAEAVLRAAIAQAPDDADLRTDLARLAAVENDWPAAEIGWRGVIAVQPDTEAGHIGLAQAIERQGRIAEAEAVLLAAQQAMPALPALLVEHARLAERSGNWAEAARRFKDVTARFPTAAAGLLGEAKAARALGRPQDAETLLRQGQALHPHEAEFCHLLAELAEQRQDWPAAATLWREFAQRSGGVFFWAYRNLCVACLHCGDVAEALRVFAQARPRFPNDEELATVFIDALLAARYNDEALALAKAELERQPPPSTHGLLVYGRAAVQSEDWHTAVGCALRLRAADASTGASAFENMLRSRLVEVGSDALDALDADQAATADRDKALLMRFESLGGDYPGCEIGLIQRRFGADPLGLLRWTTTPLDKLIQAMQAAFAGVGSPEQTNVYVAPTGDYKTQDAVFYMDMLTFVKPGDCDLATMQKRSFKRISFLRNKLIEDLQAGAKIFVYRSYEDRHDLADIRQLKAAMRSFGRNMLLYIRLSDQDNPVGSTRLVDWDLMIGYVQQFSFDPNIRLYLDGWRDICQAAARHWDSAQDFAAADAWAQQAAAANDWAEAERRHATLAESFSDRWEPVWGMAVAAREQGRLEAAEALLRRGAQAHPQVGRFLFDLAELAERRGDWPAMADCWRAFIGLHPDMPWAHAGLARALREQGQVREADAVLEQAMPHFSADLSFHLDYIRNASLTGRDAEAADRLAAARARFGLEPALIRFQAQWLRTQARLTEAAALLADAIARHPANEELAADLREVHAALDTLQADPPVDDPDLLIGPRAVHRPMPRRPVYTWYANGWMLPRWLDANHGTSFLTMAVPDDFHAVRLGYANVNAAPWTIGRLIVCASAGFGDHVNPIDADGAYLPDSAWQPVTFAGGGEDRPEVISDPDAPTTIIVAGTSLERSHGEPDGPAWTWTDWIPCHSRAPDPDTGMRVLMLRAWVPGGEMITYPNGGYEDYRLNRATNRGFEYAPFGYGLDRVSQPSLSRTDDMTVQALFRCGLINGSMFHAVQVRTRNSVIQGLGTGDSHHAGPGLLHATTQLGHHHIGRLPFGCANAAVGGLGSHQFFPRLQALMQPVNPSYVVLPGWTFNDYPTPNPDPAAIDRQFFDYLCRTAETVKAAGALPIWLTPYPRNASNMTPPILESWHWLRGTILQQRAAGELVIDAALALGCSVGGVLNGLYRPELTDDLLHPNAAGHAVVGALIAAALNRQLTKVAAA